MTADGIFAEWQPVYAEAGISTFPVNALIKKPSISGYMKTGPNLSRELAAGKFAGASAFGFACRRAGITIVDVDSTDESVLADALAEYGDTPIKVRSGSNHFHLWYRNDKERRKVRPVEGKPIDILNDGFVIAPPSQGAKGTYQFLSGSLDDLPALPSLRKPEAPEALDQCEAPSVELVSVGKRNDALWRACMRHARGCATFDDLLRFAHAHNLEALAEPLPDDEAVGVARKAWDYEARGENRFGQEQTVNLSRSQVMALVAKPDAYVLLSLLKVHNWDRVTFFVANEMAPTMPNGGWSRKRRAAARTDLMQLGFLTQVRRPSQAHGAAIYRFSAKDAA